jgi:hypothetical protein
LRHAAGSLVARHADARFVQEFLGHSRITTTERYMHAKARPQDIEVVNLAFAPQRRASTSSKKASPRATRRTRQPKDRSTATRSEASAATDALAPAG